MISCGPKSSKENTVSRINELSDKSGTNQAKLSKLTPQELKRLNECIGELESDASSTKTNIQNLKKLIVALQAKKIGEFHINNFLMGKLFVGEKLANIDEELYKPNDHDKNLAEIFTILLNGGYTGSWGLFENAETAKDKRDAIFEYLQKRFPANENKDDDTGVHESAKQEDSNKFEQEIRIIDESKKLLEHGYNAKIITANSILPHKKITGVDYLLYKDGETITLYKLDPKKTTKIYKGFRDGTLRGGSALKPELPNIKFDKDIQNKTLSYVKNDDELINWLISNQDFLRKQNPQFSYFTQEQYESYTKFEQNNTDQNTRIEYFKLVNDKLKDASLPKAVESKLIELALNYLNTCYSSAPKDLSKHEFELHLDFIINQSQNQSLDECIRTNLTNMLSSKNFLTIKDQYIIDIISHQPSHGTNNRTLEMQISTKTNEQKIITINPENGLGKSSNTNTISVTIPSQYNDKPIQTFEFNIRLEDNILTLKLATTLEMKDNLLTIFNSLKVKTPNAVVEALSSFFEDSGLMPNQKITYSILDGSSVEKPIELPALIRSFEKQYGAEDNHGAPGHIKILQETAVTASTNIKPKDDPTPKSLPITVPDKVSMYLLDKETKEVIHQINNIATLKMAISRASTQTNELKTNSNAIEWIKDNLDPNIYQSELEYPTNLLGIKTEVKCEKYEATVKLWDAFIQQLSSNDNSGAKAENNQTYKHGTKRNKREKKNARIAPAMSEDFQTSFDLYESNVSLVKYKKVLKSIQEKASGHKNKTELLEWLKFYTPEEYRIPLYGDEKEFEILTDLFNNVLEHVQGLIKQDYKSSTSEGEQKQLIGNNAQPETQDVEKESETNKPINIEIPESLLGIFNTIFFGVSLTSVTHISDDNYLDSLNKIIEHLKNEDSLYNDELTELIKNLHPKFSLRFNNKNEVWEKYSCLKVLQDYRLDQSSR